MYYAALVYFEGGSSHFAVSDDKMYTENWIEKNSTYYNNRVVLEEIENDDVLCVKFLNTRRHGKYITIARLTFSLEDYFVGGVVDRTISTSKFNTEEGVDLEAQRNYLLNKIKKKYGDENIFCIG